MASDFAPVRTYIAAQIAALSQVASCDDHYSSKRQVYPAAFIGWGDAPNRDEMNARVQRLIVPFEIRVIGSTVDQVEDALEAIGDLFVTSAQVAALGALKVPWCRLLNKNSPIAEEGAKELEGYLEMELMFERTVTA